MDGRTTSPAIEAHDPLKKLKMCINTQTPLVRFNAPPSSSSPTEEREEATRRKLPETPVDLSRLVEGVDYTYSPGGVTRMVFPLIRRMLKEGTLDQAHWISLNPSGPETIIADGVVLHSISLEKERLTSYGKVKETIWGAAHGLNEEGRTAEDIFWTDDYSEFAYYNRLSAELMRKLDKEHDFDIFYIHDFQQLPIGQMLGTLKPKVFRWHIPFDESMIPDQWRPLLASYFNSYDMVIASASRYLDSLKTFGFTGRVRKLYPYVDPADFSRPSEEEVGEVSKKLGIMAEDIVVLIVGRMDPMKGQDRALLALPPVVSGYPNLKLVLVGNGSFSGSKQGGLGLSKAERWREELRELAVRLKVTENVILAGHLTQKELDAMYERCSLTILPSVVEGFGLVVVESWLHRKPPVVSARAGVAELIEEGKNGLLFDPDDSAELTRKMRRLLDDPELAISMGRHGHATSKRCTIAEGLRAETEVITELVG